MAALKAALTRWGHEVLSATTDDMVPRIVPYAPRKTGELQDSIRRDGPVVDSGAGTFTARIVAPVIQAQTTDQGSPPHLIVPKRAGGLLVFDWPKAGGTVFLRRVNHPGNKAKPWWKRSLNATWGPALRLNALRRSLR